MSGAEPFGWSDIAAWAALMDHRLSPDEVRALLELDVAIRHPGEAESG